MAGVLAALPPAPLPTGKRARRLTRVRARQEAIDQIAALRAEGATWSAVAATVGLSLSRVRALHAGRSALEDAAPNRPDDDAILGNVRAFLLTHPDQASRRAYAAWPDRLVSPATIENRFGSWVQAVAAVSGPASTVSEVSGPDTATSDTADTARPSLDDIPDVGAPCQRRTVA